LEDKIEAIEINDKMDAKESVKDAEHHADEFLGM